jgi:hypothetical protein
MLFSYLWSDSEVFVIDDKNQAIQLVQKQELYEFGIPKMCVHSMLIRKPYIPHHLEQ